MYNEEAMYFLPTAVSGRGGHSKELLLPQFGSDSSPQNTSELKKSTNVSQYQNLYTTSPAPTASQSNLPRIYTHQSMPRFDKSLDFSVGDKKLQQQSSSIINH